MATLLWKGGKDRGDPWLGSGDPIALVFSDIVMPGSMTGYDLADWICAMKPDVKVLLTSGYRDEQLAVIATLRQVEALLSPARGNSSLAHST